jgi:hypothetical protein
MFSRLTVLTKLSIKALLAEYSPVPSVGFSTKTDEIKIILPYFFFPHFFVTPQLTN